MSKRTKHILFIFFASFCLTPLFAEQTPASPVEGEMTLLDSETTYTNLLATTVNAPDLALITSNLILRENLCNEVWYDTIYDSCDFYQSLYWKLPSGATTGEAFPMYPLRIGESFDSLYVPAGYAFQLFTNTTKPENPNDLIPYGPLMFGPRYVSLTYWRDRVPPVPNGFEPDTFFVEGIYDGLKNYSIIIYKPNGNALTKTDNAAGCVSPEDELTYEICWENTLGCAVDEAYIVDQLPVGVDYDPIISTNPLVIDPNYNAEEHTYTWNLGPIEPNDTGSVGLTVTVNEKSEPGMALHNVALFYGTINEQNPVTLLIGWAFENTSVCCWDTTGPDIIYVDKTATGNNNGTSWTDAYTDLQDGLARATASDCEENYTIYAAKGTYSPGDSTASRFTLPADTALFGGFPSGGCDFANRNPALYKTILSGTIDETNRNITIVQMNNSVLNGCIVSDSSGYGIRGSGTTVAIEHCVIIENEGYGIYTEDATPTIKNCVVANCAEGIRLLNPAESPVLYNNTIVLNDDYGVSFSDNHNSENNPNILDYPDIQNCIVYYNSSVQLAGLNPDTVAAYCCIQDCNELPELTNFNDNPIFAYGNGSGNFHLAYNSPCKDTGNPNHDNGDVGLFDMDYLDRIDNSRVDIGVDEIDCEDVSNPRDWNADGLVNLKEYAQFSAAWLSHEPGYGASAGWDPNCNLVATGDSQHVIDLADFEVFYADWLWVACWKQSYFDTYGTYSMDGGEELLMAESIQSLQTESAASAQTVIPTPTQEGEESIEQQILNLESAVKFLEQIWLEDDGIQQEIDAETWQKFMDSVYQSLLDLQAQDDPIESLDQ